MNRARPKRKILLALTCVIALLALPWVAHAAGGSGAESESQPAGVATAPVEEAVADETTALHAEVVRGLPFSNFDLLALIAVLAGLTMISFAVHRLNRDPAAPEQASITTDAK
jgi:hypothetical protein